MIFPLGDLNHKPSGTSRFDSVGVMIPLSVRLNQGILNDQFSILQFANLILVTRHWLPVPESSNKYRVTRYQFPYRDIHPELHSKSPRLPSSGVEMPFGQRSSPYHLRAC